MAEAVAMEHTITALYFSPIDPSVSGKRNSKPPVTLFMAECTDTRLLLRINPDPILAALIRAMTAIQIRSHPGTGRYASSFASVIAANRRSAIVSNLAPKEPALFVFLAQPANQIHRIEQSRKCGSKYQQNTARNADSRNDICDILFHSPACIHAVSVRK